MFQSMKLSELLCMTFVLSSLILIRPTCAQYDEANDAYNEHDLLSVAVDPVNINNGGVTFVDGEGSDGMFPQISKNAYLRSPFRLVVPEKLNEFAILATLKTNRPDGFLFSIVNSLETLVQLGIKISSSHNGKINISLIYNDPWSRNVSEALVSFSLPYDSSKWLNFAIQVWNDKIVIFKDCVKFQEILIFKEPKELIFESSSIFYLSQAGNGQHKFEV